mgnify:CR=1 FL=1
MFKSGGGGGGKIPTKELRAEYFSFSGNNKTSVKHQTPLHMNITKLPMTKTLKKQSKTYRDNSELF